MTLAVVISIPRSREGKRDDMPIDDVSRQIGRRRLRRADLEIGVGITDGREQRATELV